jgi:Holliday junction resolvase-like predicted endonuclease
VNAAREYRRVLGEIDVIVKRLPAVVNEHVKRQEATPQYWTHGADLKKARVDLLHVAAFLGDLEAKETLLAEGGDR